MANKIASSCKAWWLYLILGILATVLGIALFGKFAFTFLLAEILVGIYFLISGIGGVITTIVDRKFIPLWGLKLVLHIIVIIAGVFMLTRPSFALSFIWFICAFGFLFDGIAMIVMSVGLKKVQAGGWVVLLIFGILIILASFAIMGNPLYGAVIVNISMALGALFYGINNIVFAFEVKKLQ